MTRVAILTPDPNAEGDHATWRAALARLQAILSAEGIDAVPTPWTAHERDADGLRAFACVLPLLSWAYHLDHARWLRACRTWRRAGLSVYNPADTLAWNSDKRYLGELAARGVAIPHSTWTRQVTRAQLERVLADTGADELIVKPSVSGGAWNTRRLARADLARMSPEPVQEDDGEVLIQPYLPTITSHGETSLLFFDGVLSHAVNKRPAPGDFRVQDDHGGRYTLLDAPPAGAMALAQATLAAIDAPLLYARIDVVPDRDGRWLLMEAELIEPDLYLGIDPRRGAGFAAAVRRRLAGAAGRASPAR